MNSKEYLVNITGKYEIVEMELWDKQDIDLTEMGYIKISGNNGHIHFICVDGQMDIRNAEKNNFKFSWDGNDECDSARGFGDFICEDDKLIGRIYFHDGDDSSFLAEKIKA